MKQEFRFAIPSDPRHISAAITFPFPIETFPIEALPPEARPDEAQLDEVQKPNGQHHPPWPMVILSHGFMGFMDWSFFPLAAERLATAGKCAVVRFNFSLNGIGENPDRLTDGEAFEQNTVSQEQRDLRRVIAYLSEHAGHFGIDMSRVGLIGHSRGGGQSVLASAALPHQVKALVLWASVASFDRYGGHVKAMLREKGFLNVHSPQAAVPLRITPRLIADAEQHHAELDLEAAMRRLRIPALLLHGTEDKTVAPAESEILRRQNPLAELRLMAATSHTFNTSHPFDRNRTPPRAVEELLCETASFLCLHL